LSDKLNEVLKTIDDMGLEELWNCIYKRVAENLDKEILKIFEEMRKEGGEDAEI
jgi:hypothetical protein